MGPLMLAAEPPTFLAVGEGVDLTGWNERLLQWLQFLGLLVAVGVLLAAVVIRLVGMASWKWTDTWRRRIPGLGRYFRPTFVFEPFVSPPDFTHIGTSVVSLIADELSTAQPGGNNLEKASADASADSAVTLGQSIPNAGWLFDIAAKAIRPRRYTIRGTVHSPTDRRVSMTVEIVNRHQRVVASETVFDDRIAVSAGDPKPFYLLAPRAAAWITYTLHDVFRFPNDRKWRDNSWHPTEGKLVLVGTPHWESYGYFRQGFWYEALGYTDLAREAYHESLANDRRNIAALINLASLDLRRPEQPELRNLRRAVERLNRASALITEDEVMRGFRPNGKEIEHDKRRFQVNELSLAKRAAELEEGEDGDEPKAPLFGTNEPHVPRRQILWYRTAYVRSVARLHLALKQAEGPQAEGPQAAGPRGLSGESLAWVNRAIDDTVDLVRNQAMLLWAFQQRPPHVPPKRTTPEEAGLVNLAMQTELSAVALLAALYVEFEAADVDPLEGAAVPVVSGPGPSASNRWGFLATATREDLSFARLEQLLGPNRTISYQARYNLACAYGRAFALERRDARKSVYLRKCLKSLDLALDGDPSLREWAEGVDPGRADPSLSAVRTEPAFISLIANLKAQDPQEQGGEGTLVKPEARLGTDPAAQPGMVPDALEGVSGALVPIVPSMTARPRLQA